jgi:hypothetical protein
VGTNDNRHSLEPGSTSINQDSVSRRLGISIDNVAALPLNGITAPGILPASGPMRTTPTDHRGNKATQ